ncbi:MULTISPECIES: Npun_R2821/Npun_R2822 family protein [unclassified Nostoc]|uniref:Npun_R2821/Npun_R2822 family protein n=1 Tax=unclassified Nostoc TaxID=2593658 RepID=UPI000B958F19|nr:Npun_R2821/Npun_R2822 family protein [Nostoc sp. 'Peltigera membranacea cyanobiont' 232]OYE04732.1 methionine synthase [Nostoc sp. 'Peltigera membranacea cyanobiont' 232]
MDSFGIYTLANDVVFDQLVALLNSIEVNISADIPICIIPYNEQLDLVRQEVNARKNVILFDNWDVIQRWEEFAHQVWAAQSSKKETKLSRSSWYKSHLQRKFVGFEGIFDKFVFYDSDSLAMKPLNNVIDKLETSDFIFDDWEHVKDEAVAALNIPLIEQTGLYTEADIRSKLHCSSFFGSKRGLFTVKEIQIMKERLITHREVEWINGWWDDAFLFNYMTLRCDRPLFNFTLSPNGEDRTGNCANADPFVNINNVLYNQDGLKPIHRIHYMSYSSHDFAQLCQGQDVNICYANEFLHYRFLKQPEQRPKKLKPPSIIAKTNKLFNKTINKIQRAIR